MRLVREVLAEIAGQAGYRLQSLALEVLQESAEQIVVHWFSCLNLSAIHAKRVTVKPIDCKFFASLNQKIRDNPLHLA